MARLRGPDKGPRKPYKVQPTKVCRGPCGRELPRSEFHKRNGGRAVQSRCKVCMKEYLRDYNAITRRAMAKGDGTAAPRRRRGAGRVAEAAGAAAAAAVAAASEPDDSAERDTGRSEAERAADDVIDEVRDNRPRVPVAYIYRVDVNGHENYLDRCAPQLVSAEYLADRYGGGEYRVEFRKPGGPDGRKLVYGGKESFTIDPSIPQKNPRAAASGPISNADGSPVGGHHTDVISGAVLSLLQQAQQMGQTQMEAMRASTTAQMEAMRAIVESVSKPRDNSAMVEMLKVLVPSVVTLLTPMLTATRKEGPDPMEMFNKMMDAVKALQPAPAAAASGGSPIDAVKTAIEMMKEMREGLSSMEPGSNPPDAVAVLAGQLPKMLDSVVQIMAAKAGGGGDMMTPPPPVPAQPAPVAGSLPAGVHPPAGDVQVPMTIRMMGSYVPRLVKLAQAGKDPALYAEVTVDNIPPNMMGYLREFCLRETAVDEVLQAYPHLREFEEWSREFFDAVRTVVLGEDADDDEEGENGEAHGGAGASGHADRRGAGSGEATAQGKATTNGAGTKRRGGGRRGAVADGAGAVGEHQPGD